MYYCLLAGMAVSRDCCVLPTCYLLCLQLIMFSFELQRRLRLQGAPVDVFAVHPGQPLCYQAASNTCACLQSATVLMS